MSVMFANTGNQSSGSGFLIEFQAGRTLLEEGATKETRKAVAKPEPGLVFVRHSQDDQLLHFCWKNRQNNAVELDLIIFPGETEFLRIKECKDGRVFMLKFKNSEERHLFWMQEPNEEKDAETEKKLNELLCNAPPTRSTARADRVQPNFAALSGLQDLGALGGMDQQQLMRLFSLMNNSGNIADLLPQLSAAGVPIGPLSALLPRAGVTQQRAPTAQATSEPVGAGSGLTSAAASQPSAPAGGPISAEMLNQIFKSLPPGTSSGGEKKRKPLDFSAVLTRSNTKEVVEKYKDQLTPHLPDQGDIQTSSTELLETVGNPQFQQAADFIGQALQMGQLGQALEHFHLNRTVVEAANKGDLMQFAEKLTSQEVDKVIEEEANEEENIDSELNKEEEAKKKRKDEREKKEKEKQTRDDEGDEGMDLD